jgi:hypothetical protein
MHQTAVGSSSSVKLQEHLEILLLAERKFRGLIPRVLNHSMPNGTNFPCSTFFGTSLEHANGIECQVSYGKYYLQPTHALSQPLVYYTVYCPYQTHFLNTP